MCASDTCTALFMGICVGGGRHGGASMTKERIGIIKETTMAAIYFITVGNHKIATGHLMRCLAIARACAQKGACVKFIVSDS